MEKAKPRIDVLIFGASGFTGRNTVREIIKISEDFNEPFTWGVAGRNREKLKNILADEGKRAGVELSSIPIVIADIKDELSLNEMAKKAKVVVNCCGPYRFYGEPVVKACINNKTHHVDVSGEPQYIEKMQYIYDKSARDNGVYCISACGFDSIPADLGMVFLSNSFEGEINAVDVYLNIWNSSNSCLGASGGGLHYGTWESAVYGLAHWGELKDLRKKLFPEKLPKFIPTRKPRYTLHKNSKIGRWCLPFPGSDRSVMNRSQRYFFENEKKRPIQVNTYIAFPSFLIALGVLFFSAIFLFLSKTPFGRKLLLKHPKFFSGGLASHEGPTDELAESTHFSLTFFAEGWPEKLAELTDIYPTFPNKFMTTKVSGRNPGYGATCVALILCGLTILTENHKMPNKGGVYSPAAAFSKTNLINNLQKFGFKFEQL